MYCFVLRTACCVLRKESQGLRLTLLSVVVHSEFLRSTRHAERRTRLAAYPVKNLLIFSNLSDNFP
jgi:hypothetical protein